MAYANKTIRNTLTGQVIRFIKTGKDTAGELLEMEAWYEGQSIEPAPHYHPHQAEDFTILSGELTTKINGQLKTLRAGDKLHIPKNTVHSMWNQSGEKTIVKWQVQPALDTEYFFETATGLANDGKTNALGMPNFLQGLLLINRFSSVYRLTKPKFFVQKIAFLVLAPVAYLLGYRPTYTKYLD
ncbi:cupin domain-containing protein [Spirosoma sp. KCTC 42546]|uniref:cupin domain-containing protein n=1 Tax=Spirosoma sp. KCTC 42546 TaxID=2520506 RepID=UPI0011596BB3|nr:cupin domain-containing protein [Spirosoma sp. KCTC 42546]QDK79298.1 cupin domain-containing protein [Spirosoma sp. KCTC 42546]